MKNGNRILIIIPAYNEEEAIVSTIAALTKAVIYDYIVINDGSTDQTSALVQAHHIRHLDLPINLGIGGAMQTGYKYACRMGYDYAIQLDADGQHDPRDINRLVQEMNHGHADMVIGSRFVTSSGYDGSRYRRMGIFYFYILLRLLTGIQIKDPTSGFRMVNRRIMEQFAEHYPMDYPEVEVLVALSGMKFRIHEVSVEMRDRQGGSSSITYFRSIYYMFKVTFFSIIRRASLGGKPQ